MSASQPSPYGSRLMTSGESSMAGLASAMAPPMGEGTATFVLIVSIEATSSPAASDGACRLHLGERDVPAALLDEIRHADADPVPVLEGPDPLRRVEAVGRNLEDELVDRGFQEVGHRSYRLRKWRVASRKPSAASSMASGSVGWAWVVQARSSAVAPSWTARAPSAMRSVT